MRSVRRGRNVLHVHSELFLRIDGELVPKKAAARLSGRGSGFLLVYRKGNAGRADGNIAASLFRRRGNALSGFERKGRRRQSDDGNERRHGIQGNHGRDRDGNAFERGDGRQVWDYGEKCGGDGRGANSDAWLQIKADIQDIPVRALRSSEGGLCGCAMLSAVALGGADNLEEAREIFVRYRKEFLPDPAAGKAYRAQYGKYKKLYHCIKEMF